MDSIATTDSAGAEDVFFRSVNSSISNEEVTETVASVQEITLEAPDSQSQQENPGTHPLDRSTSASSLNSDTYIAAYQTAYFTGDLAEAARNMAENAAQPDDVADGNSKKASDSGSKSALTRKVEAPKPSLKTLISQFMSGTNYIDIESPFGINEHYLLNTNNRLPVLVKDEDPGSIIAFALSSVDYDKQLMELMKASPCRVKPNDVVRVGISPDADSSQVTVNSGSAVFTKSNLAENQLEPEPHIEVQFSDSLSRFRVICYFAEHFRSLRAETIELSSKPHLPSTSVVIEEMFVRALSAAFEWKATGGKSGSHFRKTMDERFIIKEISRQEMTSVLAVGKAYFEHLETSKRNARPTILAKIFGVYKIEYTISGTSYKKRLIVMENLFYNRNIIQKFDLKGSERNRLAETNTKDEVVLLDENLVRMLRDTPLYVRPHSKKLLQEALENDSQFLTSHEILDYSLLVGVDDDKKELVVGLIDFIRTFTWDKKVESIMKRLPQVADKNKPNPTIVKPESYRERFLQKMNQYFMPVPNAGFKSDADSKSSTDFHF